MKSIVQKVSLAFLVYFVFSNLVLAQIKLPAIVSSNMVLQRSTTVKVWGWSGNNTDVTIKASWLATPLKTKSNNNGRWETEIKTTESKLPQSIIISDKSSNVKLENVLFGEVWLCSGQSNMQMGLNGYSGQPILGANMAVAKSRNTNLRIFTVSRVGAKTPLEDVEKYEAWQSASPENIFNFSAIGYMFGSQLQEILDVPVGIIHTSWGGSIVEAWMSKEVLSKFQEVNIDNAKLENSSKVNTALYNAMIAPLIPFTIKGALWYQGESNKNNPEMYKKLFPAMVEDWRLRWKLGDFPFYYAQLAPYSYGADSSEINTTKNSAFIRETQMQCLDIIPNSGIAITMDLGKEFTIHPPQKQEVADRLLFNALNKTYAIKSVDCEGPKYDSHVEMDGGLEVKFLNAEIGLYTATNLTDFEIAGENRVFYKANASIKNGKQVFVKSEKVPKPVAVRYAWRNWVQGTLYDTNGLPASSFRSDNWTDATQATDK